MVELSEQTLRIIRLWLLVVQIPLIIIMGFDGKEWSDWKPILAQLPASMVPTALTVRYHTLLAIVVIQVLNIPAMLIAVLKMSRILIQVAAALAFALLISSFVLMITGHMKAFGADIVGGKEKARSWFGLLFSITYFLPLALLGIKLPAN